MRRGFALAAPEAMEALRRAKAHVSGVNATLEAHLALAAVARRGALLDRARRLRDANLARYRAFAARADVEAVEPSGSARRGAAPRARAG